MKTWHSIPGISKPPHRIGSDGRATLPWLLLAALLIACGAAGILYSKVRQQQAALAQARLELRDLDQLRRQIQEQQNQADASEELELLRRDKQELVKLRGEVVNLRPLKEQVQQLQTENQQLRGQMQQLQQTAGEVNTLKNQNQQLQGAIAAAQENEQRNTCIANLRKLQATKIQWAKDQGKTIDDTPTDEDLFGAGKYLSEKPDCPAHGQYVLGAVSEKPTCSIPGHQF
jgi:hypothetical protein